MPSLAWAGAMSGLPLPPAPPVFPQRIGATLPARGNVPLWPWWIQSLAPRLTKAVDPAEEQRSPRHSGSSPSHSTDRCVLQRRPAPCVRPGFTASAVALRRETNLLRATLLGSACPARVCRRVPRGRGVEHRERSRARPWASDGPFVKAGKPGRSAQGPVWSFHDRSNDLQLRGVPPRRDGRGQPGHDAQ